MSERRTPMDGRRTFLLTGATGFLGKVILEELVRRHAELALDKVYVVIRAKGGRSAADRFAREVAASPCFEQLPADWTRFVEVLEATLEQPDLHLNGQQQELERSVTHVIHAAASVSFDLPVAEAAQANVATALNVLELAKRCRRLRRMVTISTAYVTPHDGGVAKVPEALAPLPAPAADLLQGILDGTVSESRLLRDARLPNTYTVTKSIAEHLLMERRGAVPLTLLRPSVISASLHHPVPGWIDSTAGFGGFVLMLGLGHLRAVVGERDSRLDIIPVDQVAGRALSACLDEGAPAALIRHVTAGRQLSPTLMDCWAAIEDFYGSHTPGRRPRLRYMGPRRLGFHLADVLHHRLPIAVASMGSKRKRSKARFLQDRLAHLNRVFPYFTTNSFDFESSEPLGDGFEPKSYVRLACQGMHRHVLRHDRSQWVLAGARHGGHGGDLAWSFRKPHGNLWVRLAAWQTTKVLRKTLDQVTVDLHSFEAARRKAPAGTPLAIVATHRSYLDFVLVSYLAFARPDLGIPIPHVAATIEFGKVPVLGRVLSSLHAFYLRRGTGREDPELTRRVHRLVQDGKALEFFIEGTRSRSREFLEPKRGLLRCLQGTGAPVTVLPVTLSYDRVPEEASFAAELAGAPKPKMRLSTLLRWLSKARRGKVSLGRAHIACGEPIVLAPDSDIHAVSRAIMEQLRRATVATTYHLEAYLAHHPQPGLDAAGLRRLIESHGGKVLDSALAVPPDLDPLIAATLRHQFSHWMDTPVDLQETAPVADGLVATPRPVMVVEGPNA